MLKVKCLILLSSVVIFAFFVACIDGCNVRTTSVLPGTKVKVEGGGYSDITPVQLETMLANKDFLLIDNETSESMSEIEGTDLFIKADEISQNMDKLPVDKSTKIVVYCVTGAKSKDVATVLVKAGYNNVMHLVGGLISWQLWIQEDHP
jgi:rhodanese-related sulfurtransferase